MATFDARYPNLAMDKQQIISSVLPDTLSYADYIALIERVHAEEKATSFQDDRSYYEHSKMSLTRMNRIYKRQELDAELLRALKAIDQDQIWLLISESWCGDASQTVPIIARAAEENEHISLHIVLRDTHPAVMDLFLTDGGRSIPMLAILDADLMEIGRWGPRSAHAQQMVTDYKAMAEPKPLYEELSTDIQRWYTSDKGVSTQAELVELLKETQS